MRYELKGCKLDSSRISETESYSANNPWRITLNRNKNHTMIRARATIGYTTASGASTVEDGLAKLLTGIAVQINRGVKLMEVVDGQQLVLYNQHLNRGRGTNDQPNTSVGAHTGYVDFFFNVPLDMQNPENPVVAIPGQNDDLVDVDLVGTWGSSIGSNYTITSGSIEVVEDKGWVCPTEKVNEYYPIATRVMPNWYYGTYQFTGAVGNFGLSIDLNSRVAIRNIFLIVKDSGGDRSDSIVTEFSLRRYDNVDILGPVDWDAYQRGKADQLDMSALTGCTLIDLRQDVATTAFSTPQGLVLPRDGDVQLIFSTSGAGSITYLFDAVMTRTTTI